MIYCFRILAVTFLIMLMGGTLRSQSKVTLSGYVKDTLNGEALTGATIYVNELKTGTVTNVYGFYSITISAGVYQITYSFVGYTTKTLSLHLENNQQVNIDLSDNQKLLKEVVISSEADAQNKVANMEMGTNSLSIGQIKKIPALLGEVDVIKSLQFLPGVSTVGEGSSGFNVRGGSVGQNLILLDEAPVYNSSHMLGFFSAFNPDAVKDVKLYKAAIPAQHGGRISSLLDVRMKEGNNKRYETNGGVGLIFSRVAFEGPIVREKGSFIVAARRSYIDVLARPFLSSGFSLNFYDITAKANYSFSEKNKVFVSGYFGRDNFDFGSGQGLNWGSQTGTSRWNHVFNPKLFLNLSLIYSKYDYQLKFGTEEKNKFQWNSSITNLIVKPEFTYFITADHQLTFGAQAIHYTFDPAKTVGVTNGEAVNNSLEKKYGLEWATYAAHSFSLQSWGIEYGVRLSGFELMGPGTAYTYNDTIPGRRRRAISSRYYSSGQSIADFITPEPRISIRKNIGNNSSVKLAYNRTAQYIHLISNTTASNPLDIWTPSSNNLKPEVGDQYTVGYFRNIEAKQSWEASVEFFYKNMEHQIDYINGADLLINKYLEGDLLSGKGRAYGAEFYVQKKTGKLNGWASYTLSRTELQVDGINQGRWYAARYDQTHNIKFAAFYELNKRWSISANFVYTTGTPVTSPNSKYYSQGIAIPYIANNERNNYRLKDYHRLDVSFRMEGRELDRHGKRRKNRDYWVFSLYNLYSRKNAFSVYFDQTNDRSVVGQAIQTQAKQVSIIGSVIPSVSYNFHF